MTEWQGQSREDKIAQHIFNEIGTTNCVCVDIGAMDGTHGSNTAHFRELGWTAHLFDVEPLDPMVTKAEITAENVNAILSAAGVPAEFDLLSIDIDGNDLWVWKALTSRPRVVIIEYNQRWNWKKSRTVAYDPARRWDKTVYYGASARALCTLATEKGYDLVAGTRANLVFVLAGLMPAIELDSLARRKKFKKPDAQHRKWVEYAS